MFDYERLLSDYRMDHRNVVNKVFHFLGIPLIVVSLLIIAIDWRWSLGLFLIGWILQISGHLVFEKNRPAFTKNIVHLLIGPMWWIETVSLYRLWKKPLD